ncbi:hypothetical protein [Chitinophaga barathri]|uniref:Uncharacterized protein n=1 Tax=Chitinophaga barathri TaxID=1647451 RepID=A0A3N4MF75_9BACT|nr:hypothetical protein [Chitinophaga barathri]RPD42481.1 hypothetical protein EG028_04715 [Chitinophaga barathri]
MNQLYKKLIQAVACLFLLWAAASCNKETEYGPSPYNRVESFSVAAGTETILASIVGDSIVVYWPSHIPQPEKINPQIIVTENASVTPTSGTAVNFRTGTAFTVKAQSGAEKKFYLKVIMNQPPIQVAEQSYSAVKGGSLVVDNGTVMRYFERDAAKTKFFIIDDQNTTTELPLEFFISGNGESSMRISVPDVAAVKVGAYKLRITSGIHTYTSANKIFGVLYGARPVADEVSTPVTVKQGGTITFQGSGFIDMQEARVFGYNADWSEKEVASLPVESFTATTVTYRIPATFPAGVYELGGWDTNGIFIALRTSDYMGFWRWDKVQKNYVNIDGSTSFTVTP